MAQGLFWASLQSPRSHSVKRVHFYHVPVASPQSFIHVSDSCIARSISVGNPTSSSVSLKNTQLLEWQIKGQRCLKPDWYQEKWGGKRQQQQSPARPWPVLEPLPRLLRCTAAVNLPGSIQCDSDTSQHIASNLIWSWQRLFLFYIYWFINGLQPLKQMHIH